MGALGSLGDRLDIARPMGRPKPSIVPPPQVEEQPISVHLSNEVEFRNRFHLSDNAIEETLAPLMTPFEYAIYRRLWFDSFGGMGSGNRKNHCRAGYDYLLRMTACKSRKAVINGVKGLLEKQFILRLDNDKNHPTGSLYRVVRPQEIQNGCLEEGTPLSDLKEHSLLGVEPGSPEAQASQTLPPQAQPQEGRARRQSLPPRTLAQTESAKGHTPTGFQSVSRQGAAPSLPAPIYRDFSAPKEKKEERQRRKKTETSQEFLEELYRAVGESLPKSHKSEDLTLAEELRSEEGILEELAEEVNILRRTLSRTPSMHESIIMARPFAELRVLRMRKNLPLPTAMLMGPRGDVELAAQELIKELEPDEVALFTSRLKEELFVRTPKARHWKPGILEQSIQTILRKEIRRRLYAG